MDRCRHPGWTLLEHSHETATQEAHRQVQKKRHAVLHAIQPSECLAYQCKKQARQLDSSHQNHQSVNKYTGSLCEGAGLYAHIESLDRGVWGLHRQALESKPEALLRSVEHRPRLFCGDRTRTGYGSSIMKRRWTGYSGYGGRWWHPSCQCDELRIEI